MSVATPRVASRKGGLVDPTSLTFGSNVTHRHQATAPEITGICPRTSMSVATPEVVWCVHYPSSRGNARVTSGPRRLRSIVEKRKTPRFVSLSASCSRFVRLVPPFRSFPVRLVSLDLSWFPGPLRSVSSHSFVRSFVRSFSRFVVSRPVHSVSPNDTCAVSCLSCSSAQPRQHPQLLRERVVRSSCTVSGSRSQKQTWCRRSFDRAAPRRSDHVFTSAVRRHVSIEPVAAAPEASCFTTSPPPITAMSIGSAVRALAL
jgi:hypothetical protein